MRQSLMIRLLRVGTNHVSCMVCHSVRTTLDYDKEVHRSKNFKGMEQYDGYKIGFHQPGFTLWPRLLQWRTPSMNERMTCTNMATLFASGVLQRSSFSGNLKPLDNKIDLERTPTWGLFKNWKKMFPSCPPYQQLPQITYSWADILDQLMHFFTVV